MIRRWFFGLEPIFEGGRRGKRARSWEVEDQLVAVAILGDVTIDLAQAARCPADVTIDAYAVLRDVEIVVGDATQVELDGGVVRGDLHNEAPSVAQEERHHLVRVHGRSLLGDVTVRLAT